MSSQTNHDKRNRTDPTRRADQASYIADISRCRHPHKQLLADGNSFWCEPCKRVVGFVRLPKVNKVPR
jgi:hypothetical protein